jgi:hypothetical protein
LIAALRPPRATAGSLLSTSEFHSPHSPQRPIQRNARAPHWLQM